MRVTGDRTSDGEGTDFPIRTLDALAIRERVRRAGCTAAKSPTPIRLTLDPAAHGRECVATTPP